MGDQVYSGILALMAGLAVGIVLFIPFVAISYRRRGGLSPWRFVLWAAALVYFWAIWTYTLLPLPSVDDVRCAGVNLQPLALIDEIRGAIARPGDTLRDPAVLQIVLNVLLFVPLGFFVRVLGGRGILVALLAGLGTSLMVEFTQLTGVWGVYPCAYRVFDVDDLLTNTVGAVLGSLLALIVPRVHHGAKAAADADEPRPVTRGRRLLAMVCDGLGIVLVFFALSVGTQIWLQYVAGDRAAVLDGTFSSLVGVLGSAGLWLVVVLATGRSVGDLAVQLRYAGGPLPGLLRRVLRFAGGVGGVMLLDLLPDAWAWVQAVFVLAAVVLVFTTRAGRGLPGVLSGQQLRDARARVGE